MPIEVSYSPVASMAHVPVANSSISRSVSGLAAEASFQYRPDIDGIRALAVSSVVLFHAFPAVFPGGFVGVDIFFVISGFLISSIIFKDLEKNTFSFLNFYSGRIRRIFPALLLVLAVCIVFGWFALFTNEFAALGKHVAASAAFIENIQLWRESGYFDTDSAVKPLLHLWSLGIEEQFYVVWPLLLPLVYYRTRCVPQLIVVLLAISFALNLALIGTDPTATFYLAFSRFWELLFGCFLAYVLFKKKQQLAGLWGNPFDAPRNATSSSASVVGLSLIGAAVIFLNSQKAFPGLWALLPVVGTFLLIGAGSNALVNRKILAQPALVSVGLISYPIYLWHWPLLSLARIMIPQGPSVGLRVGLVALAVLLAWLTYQYVEKPVRFGKERFGRRNKTFVLIALMMAAAVTGLAMKISDGFANVGNRKNVLISDLESSSLQARFQPCATSLKDTYPTLNYCLQSLATAPTAAIFGDSHADHLFAGVSRADPGRSWLLIGNSACPPVSGIDVQSEIKDCQLRSEKAIDYLRKDQKVDTVVLSFFANFFLDTDYAADHLEKPDGPSKVRIKSSLVPNYSKAEMAYYGLDAAITRLEQAGKQIVLVIDVPELPFEPQSCIERPLTREVARKDCSVSIESARERQSKFRMMTMKLKSSHPRLEVYDSFDSLCKGDRCLVESDGIMRYRDSHHLSLRGSELLGKDLIRWWYSFH